MVQEMWLANKVIKLLPENDFQTTNQLDKISSHTPPVTTEPLKLIPLSLLTYIQLCTLIILLIMSNIYLFHCNFQENKIKEELEKKIDKLREQADVNKQEIEQGQTKIDEVIALYTYWATYTMSENNSFEFWS